ncbi:unnamed protein product [Phytophthora fragariaefolia]|uniref:Unnamed protein product n=1 Tax=Phytophthora fragariaefolia TaxID=1490495 RepID=A0A9W6YBN5_9STRA|nr:unnamed protein product [Phytophthora fragariaefolia]
MENAAKWWVDMGRRTPERKRTWTNLKKTLLRRYGEKLDKSAAEWRVSMRRMMPGETHADFGAGLRDVVGRNRVSELILSAQFYRCLDKTAKKLAKQHPKPRTLEEAVDKATEIDDPMGNVAQVMINIGQGWATAPSRYVIPLSGTMGNTNVIPGVSGTGLPSEMLSGAGNEVEVQQELEHVALFTNPQGVYNAYSGTWDPPPGHVWNGKYWYEPRKSARKAKITPATPHVAEAKRTAAKAKQRQEKLASSSDESDAKPRRKKAKAAVRQVTTGGRGDSQQRAEVVEHSARAWQVAIVRRMARPIPAVDKQVTGRFNAPSNRFATHAISPVTLPKQCTNAEAKAANDAYLQQREAKDTKENK